MFVPYAVITPLKNDESIIVKKASWNIMLNNISIGSMTNAGTAKIILVSVKAAARIEPIAEPINTKTMALLIIAIAVFADLTPCEPTEVEFESVVN